jgi:pseudouridine synthase
MAQCGVASRRKCEEMIQDGTVTVNGKTVVELGTVIDDKKDTVLCGGKPITGSAKKYYILNKPSRCITSNSDPQGRKTIFDIIKSEDRLFAVGRLDYDSEGLLIVTNDGSFANRISHPRYQVSKTYEVLTRERPKKDQLAMLEGGMYVEGEKTSKARVKVKGNRNGRTVSAITICEGRKRQVRRMYASAGLTVVSLKRTHIGAFSDTSLKPGSYRKLKKKERELIISGGTKNENV